LQVGIQHSGEHQFDEEPRVFFRKSVSLNASLFRQYRPSWFNDSPNATRLQMFQQCGLPAAERACQKEKTILHHNKTILKGDGISRYSADGTAPLLRQVKRDSVRCLRYVPRHFLGIVEVNLQTRVDVLATMP
jgi:hypothetical protein